MSILLDAAARDCGLDFGGGLGVRPLRFLVVTPALALLARMSTRMLASRTFRAANSRGALGRGGKFFEVL